MVYVVRTAQDVEPPVHSLAGDRLLGASHLESALVALYSDCTRQLLPATGAFELEAHFFLVRLAA